MHRVLCVFVQKIEETEQECASDGCSLNETTLLLSDRSSISIISSIISIISSITSSTRPNNYLN